MEKRTLLAVGLSMAVMILFIVLQNALFPPPEPVPPPEPSSQGTHPQVQESPSASVNQETPSPGGSTLMDLAGETLHHQTVVVETELMRVVLTNAGGDIVSYQLKKHMDHGDPVEMIFAGTAEPRAFGVAFGNMDDVLARRVSPEERYFRVRRVSEHIVEFSQDFTAPGGGQFTMVKRYEFRNDEYLFELTVSLDGGYSMRSFDFQGAAYTLVFGPQIGPKFEKLDQRYEYRRYLTYKGKLKTERVTDRDATIIDTQPSWAAIAGKYFTFIAMPYANQYDLAFSTQAERGLPGASRLFITRPASGSSRIEDKYHFYLGPKNQESLTIYERGDNGFRLRETGFIEVADSKGFLAPLEKVLKWFLMIFYRIIPNYGVAIILLTLLVKVIMFPLTKKGSESTLKMQTLSPKIKEIQDKYKENPKKMNAEMAEFYKKEGYNPLSGCLPMLVQLPIFFAMYNLFNSHFDLRNAMFIPGWIPDLSLPEAIYNFPDNFRLPLLGWSAIRLLPFIYVGSQLLYGKVTQTPDQKGNNQMKLMMYAMPIVFFFVLYDVPSGLLLYWIMSNVLTMVQQLSINRYIARKKAVIGAVEPRPVIAPTRKKKKSGN